MKSMIENVAEAICNEAFEKLGAPKCYHLNKALYDDVAKAALEAMKEPTQRMIEDGSFALDPGWPHSRDASETANEFSVKTWQAMIQAAIDENKLTDRRDGMNSQELLNAVLQHLETLTPIDRVNFLFDIRDTFCVHCGDNRRDVSSGEWCHCTNDE